MTAWLPVAPPRVSSTRNSVYGGLIRSPRSSNEIFPVTPVTDTPGRLATILPRSSESALRTAAIIASAASYENGA